MSRTDERERLTFLDTDLERLKTEYARRAGDERYRDWYSPFNPGNIFIRQERDREMARWLAPFAGGLAGSWRVLDVGCGDGTELARFVHYGADSRHLFGVDLLADRIQRAKERYSNLHFAQGNAAALPFPESSFDLVVQFTVFTSILDVGLRGQMAKEMLRVLKPGGLVLWYDYIFNPTNSQTRGIGQAEIRRLFPECVIRFRRVTLAPPLARRVAPRSWVACVLLSQIPILRTHYLALVKKGDKVPLL